MSECHLDKGLIYLDGGNLATESNKLCRWAETYDHV